MWVRDIIEKTIRGAFRRIFSPGPSTVVVTTSISIGIGLALASQPRNIHHAHLFFFLAWVFVLGCTVNLVANRNFSRLAVGAIICVVVLAIGILSTVCVIWVQANYHDSISANAPSQVPLKHDPVATMKGLYVKFVKLNTQRVQAYERLMVAENQAEIDQLGANNLDKYPQNEWGLVDSKARDSSAKWQTQQQNVDAVNIQMFTLLGQIRIAFPPTAEMSRLLDGARSRPTYFPTALTREDIPILPSNKKRLHLWVQKQGALATKSIRTQLIHPQNSLRAYLQDQITEVESLSHP